MSLEQKLEALAPIPTDLKPLLLPNAAATIQHLISFPTPSFEQPPAIITGTQITLSKEPSTLFHDRTDLLRLQQLPLLAYSDLQKLAQAALESSPDVASFTYPLEQALSEHVGPHDAWPLWVLVYWLHVYQVLNAKGHWALLLAKVAAVGGDSAVIERLPWNVPLPSDNQAGRGSLGHVMSLLAFGTREWLNSTHMDLLLYSLEFTINDPDILVLNTWMFDILWSLHNIDPTSYPSQAHAALTTMGTRIRTAKQILLVVPVCIGDGKAVVGGLGIMSNHWISAVIDPKLQEVRHYDPMSIRPPDGLLALINWWLGMHGEPPYTHDSIPCTLQRDSYSCGLLCVNALAHDALPARFPLLDSHGCDQGRIQMLEQIIQYLGHLVSHVVTRSFQRLLSP
ncbi:hypothetical protein BD626DRAFT_199867 [Schizophyllum amplum]|uniref:Ubiquitin-like protease family profile domain-containing protein n=1 Tax=Schizophyllum amplum TaxID=97359 RepID=A0A550CN74_9AGAR|nr:hypothetical protein BD626DRAFT_199867 [Auriculariopsis ampla]